MVSLNSDAAAKFSSSIDTASFLQTEAALFEVTPFGHSYLLSKRKSCHFLCFSETETVKNLSLLEVSSC